MGAKADMYAIAGSAFNELIQRFALPDGSALAEFSDIEEASDWLFQNLDRFRAAESLAEVETLLIDVKIHFVEHMMHHLKSLDAFIDLELEQIANQLGDE